METAAIREIWTYLFINMIPLGLLGIVLITIAVLALLKHIFKVRYVLLLFLLGALTVGYAIAEISLFHFDLKEEAFEEYSGSFVYKDVSGNLEDRVQLIENPNLYVRSISDYSLLSDTYCGQVLYCRRSRWVIQMSAEPLLLE